MLSVDSVAINIFYHLFWVCVISVCFRGKILIHNPYSFSFLRSVPRLIPSISAASV